MNNVAPYATVVPGNSRGLPYEISVKVTIQPASQFQYTIDGAETGLIPIPPKLSFDVNPGPTWQPTCTLIGRIHSLRNTVSKLKEIQGRGVIQKVHAFLHRSVEITILAVYLLFCVVTLSFGEAGKVWNELTQGSLESRLEKQQDKQVKDLEQSLEEIGAQNLSDLHGLYQSYLKSLLTSVEKAIEIYQKSNEYSKKEPVLLAENIRSNTERLRNYQSIQAGLLTRLEDPPRFTMG